MTQKNKIVEINLTKKVKRLYIENYKNIAKTMKKVRKTALNGKTFMLFIGRLNNIKTPRLLKVI